MHKNKQLLSTLVVLIFFTAPLYGMLILKQEKNNSPAYICIKERKLKKDLRLLRQEERDGFEHIITFGKVLVSNAGTIMKAVETATTLVIANIASQAVTGKKWNESHRSQRGYDIDEPNYKKEREKMERVNDASPYIWNAQKGCFYDYDGNRLEIVGGSLEEPKTDIVYTSMITIPTNNDVKNIREVDFQHNESDKGWLKGFANKICPSGGYIIGDVDISCDEEIQNDIVAVPLPIPPHKPNNDKNSHDDIHEKIEKFHDAVGHHLGEHALEEKIEEYREHDSMDHKKHQETQSSVKVYTPGTNASTQSSTYMHKEPNSIKTKTHASSWATDDYYSNSSSSSSNSGSYDRSSSGAADRYHACKDEMKSATFCKLYKDE